MQSAGGSVAGACCPLSPHAKNMTEKRVTRWLFVCPDERNRQKRIASLWGAVPVFFVHLGKIAVTAVTQHISNCDERILMADNQFFRLLHFGAMDIFCERSAYLPVELPGKAGTLQVQGLRHVQGQAGLVSGSSAVGNMRSYMEFQNLKIFPDVWEQRLKKTVGTAESVLCFAFRICASIEEFSHLPLEVRLLFCLEKILFGKIICFHCFPF